MHEAIWFCGAFALTTTNFSSADVKHAKVSSYCLMVSTIAVADLPWDAAHYSTTDGIVPVGVDDAEDTDRSRVCNVAFASWVEATQRQEALLHNVLSNQCRCGTTVVVVMKTIPPIMPVLVRTR